jgi:hypothetical protein
MAIDYGYPDNITLNQIAQELVPALEANRPIFQDFPIKNVEDDVIEWDQRGNYIGLQQIRGLGGLPNHVKRIGASTYRFEPGYYGEYLEVNERELLRARQLGTLSGRVNLTEKVAELQAQLLQRRYDRIESIIWTLLATGTYSVAQGNIVMATDTFTLQTFSAAVPWATVATATPLADMRTVQLKQRGYSLSFGTGAKAWMNRTTFNSLLSNTNQADLGGRRGAGLSTINGPAGVNQLMAMDDLPDITVYDGGYYDDTSTFQLFIPNNKVIVVGKRTNGDMLGEYRCTLNVNQGDGGSGPYMLVWDSAKDGGRPPRHIEVHDGHNGGPALYHPFGIAVMTV